MTGESGVFLDPFYSPGSDFIAIANTYITELIAHDRAGQPVASYARIYEQFFMSFYDSTMSLYRDQYAMFGDPEVLPVKVIWDYTYYWGVLCQLFFQRRLTDLSDAVARAGRVERQQGAQLRDAGFPAGLVESAASAAIAGLLDQAQLDWFTELNRGLRDALDDAAFEARIRADDAAAAELAREIVDGLYTSTGPRRRARCLPCSAGSRARRPPACCSNPRPDAWARCRTRRCCSQRRS